MGLSIENVRGTSQTKGNILFPWTVILMPDPTIHEENVSVTDTNS